MMRRVVCNTGPLIALSGAARLDLLRGLFEEVLIPQQVRDEVLAGGTNATGAQAFRAAAWIRAESLSGPPTPLLLDSLDDGEAAVIQLAREREADMVLIDERKGRKIAADVFGLRVRGTVGLLVDAKKRGLVPDIKSLLAQIRENGYWIDDVIVNAALREASE